MLTLAHVQEQNKVYGTWCLHLSRRVPVFIKKVYKKLEEE